VNTMMPRGRRSWRGQAIVGSVSPRAGGVGGAGKTEGQPHASPAELATDTLGQPPSGSFRTAERAGYPRQNIWLCNEK
jgi:hypothetical protein